MKAESWHVISVTECWWCLEERGKKASSFHIFSIIHTGGAEMYWNTGEGHSNLLQIVEVTLENAP